MFDPPLSKDAYSYIDDPRAWVKQKDKVMVGDASPIDPKLSLFAQEQLTRSWNRVLHNLGSLSGEQFNALRDAVLVTGYCRTLGTHFPVGEMIPNAGAPIVPAYYETDPDDIEGPL